MFKRHVKKITAFTLVFMLGLSTTAFASTPAGPSSGTTVPNAENQRMHKVSFRKEGFKALLQQLGLTKEDLNKGREANKTIFDLAKEKGYTNEQVKEMLLKNETAAINKAVQEGKITKEKADELLGKVKERIANWDGTPKHKHMKEKAKTETQKQ